MRKPRDIGERHQLKIARDTLRMHDAGAAIMGGMSKDEARSFLLRFGYSELQISRLEGSDTPQLRA